MRQEEDKYLDEGNGHASSKQDSEESDDEYELEDDTNDKFVRICVNSTFQAYSSKITSW